METTRYVWFVGEEPASAIPRKAFQFYLLSNSEAFSLAVLRDAQAGNVSEVFREQGNPDFTGPGARKPTFSKVGRIAPNPLSWTNQSILSKVDDEQGTSQEATVMSKTFQTRFEI